MRHTIHSLVSLLSIITLSAAGCGSEQPAEDDARGAASTGTGAETGSGGEGAASGGRNAGGGDENAGGGNAGGGDGNAGGGNAGGGGGGETPSAYVEVADGVAHLAFSSTPATCGAAPDFPDYCTDRDEFLLEVEIPIDLLVVGTVDPVSYTHLR